MSPPLYLIYLLRRDLRLSDNPIFHALKETTKFTHLLPLYILPPHQIEVSGLLDPAGVNSTRSPYPEARSRLGKFWRSGPHRVKFLAEGLFDLKTGLNAIGSDLVVRVGPMQDVVRDLLTSQGFKGKVGAVWMMKDWASEEVDEEQRVAEVVQEMGDIEWKVWDGEEMLIHEFVSTLQSGWYLIIFYSDDLPMKVSQLPDVFTSFRKSLEPLRDHVRGTVPAPAQLIPIPANIPPQASPFVIPTTLSSLITALQSPLHVVLKPAIHHPPNARSAHPFLGGETHAHARIRHLISSGTVKTYKSTRNGMLGSDFSTKLSAYLSLGFITARQIHTYLLFFENGKNTPSSVPILDLPYESLDGVDGFGKGENEGTAAIRFELLWRDYMRLCMRKYGTRLFSIHGFRGPTNPNRHPNPSTPSPPWLTLASASARSSFSRFQSGTTGTGLIDASMRELHLTGYTSNRARQNCASFLSQWLRLDWRLGAEWYESLLVDHDVASNWGNWQYVAGVGNDPRGSADGGGVGRRFNPVKQGWDYDPRGEYVGTWVEELRGVRDVGIRLQGWTVRESLTAKSSDELKRFSEIDWVKDPLVEIQYVNRTQRSGSKGNGKRARGSMRSAAAT